MTDKTIETLLDELINSEPCPQCDNSGSYPGGNEETGVEECQCQFCYTVTHSVFNDNNVKQQILSRFEALEKERDGLREGIAWIREYVADDPGVVQKCDELLRKALEGKGEA